MDKTVSLSIIVPIYNGAKYLRECVGSVLRQSFQDYELILVDDGSTDNSLQICYDFAGRDSRIVVLETVHGGLLLARKRGVEKARAPYIGFLDSDDYIDEDMFEKMYEVAARYEPDLISTDIINEYKNSSVYLNASYGEGLYTNLEKDIYPSMLWDFKRESFGIMPSLVIKLFKRELLLNVYQEIDERVCHGEDALTSYTYCMKAKNLYVIRQAYYHYRRHANSMCSEKGNPTLMDDMWRLYQGLRLAFQGTEREWELMRQLRRFMMEVNAHMMRNLFDINPEIYPSWYFSCSELLEHQLVLYGAGVCGQAFYQYALKKGKEKNIVAWLDRLGQKKNIECLHVIRGPEALGELKYDFLVIAVSEPAQRDAIIQDLRERYSVDQSRIRWEGGKV